MQATDLQAHPDVAGPGMVRVSVVFAPQARQWQSVNLELPTGATIAHAVRQSQLLDGLDGALLDTLAVGLWGRKATLTQVLRDGDRIELCRPLKVDPKLARRQRFARQGAKAAGLFAKRRVGAKAGY